MGTKISALAAITGANTAAGDLLVITDVSDTTQGAGGTTKSITRDSLLNSGVVPAAFSSLNGVTVDTTTNKPVTAASLAGATLPGSFTTLAASNQLSVTRTDFNGAVGAKIRVESVGASSGYGLIVESEATAGSGYAFICRNLAGTVDYFKVSTATGSVGAVTMPSGGGLAVTGAVSATGVYSLGSRGTTSYYGLPDWRIYNSTSGNKLVIDNSGATSLELSGSTGLTFAGAITASTTIKAGTTISVGNATPSASGAGISFPATQSASTDPNTLCDFERGLHVPTVTPGTSGTVTINTNIKTLAYTKIDKLVHLTGLLRVASVSSPVGSFVNISIPFAVGGAAQAYENRVGGAMYSVVGGLQVLSPFEASEGDTTLRVYQAAASLITGDDYRFDLFYQAST